MYFTLRDYFSQCVVLGHVVDPLDRVRWVTGLAMLAQTQMRKLMASIFGGGTAPEEGIFDLFARLGKGNAEMVRRRRSAAREGAWMALPLLKEHCCHIPDFFPKLECLKFSYGMIFF